MKKVGEYLNCKKDDLIRKIEETYRKPTGRKRKRGGNLIRKNGEWRNKEEFWREDFLWIPGSFKF